MLVCCSILLFNTGCNHTAPVALPYYHTSDFTPLWQANADTIHRIAPFRFRDQQGNTITEKDYEGKIYAANFFFTTCFGICPKMMNNLQLVADTFAANQDVLLLSFSVMPEVDTIEKLNEYARLNNIDATRWHLLTGNRAAIYSLARQSFFAEAEPGLSKDSTEFLHTEHILLVDNQGHIRGVYNGTLELDAKRLTDDMRLLLSQR